MKQTIASLGLILLISACTESVCPEESYRIGNRCSPLPATSDASAEETDASAEETDASAEIIDAGTLLEEDDAGTTFEEDSCTPRNYYRDLDRDGHGDPESLISTCIAPEDYVETGDDCNDDCPTCFPDAAELCDQIDQDCDGSIDEELRQIVTYADSDGDEFGDATTMRSSCRVEEGRVLTPGDCDDRSPSVHPVASETCNHVDDDCDGRMDEGVTIMIYRDTDEDGFGVEGEGRPSCEALAGFSTQPGDCNDEPNLGGARAYPGATETCDGIDNDCDVEVDEGVMVTYYEDCDRDGYAWRSTGSYLACEPSESGPASCPGGGWTARVPGSGNRDCLDTDATTFPGNPGWYTTRRDGTPAWDHNCDGQTEIRDTNVAVLSCGRLANGHCVQPAPGWVDSAPNCGGAGTYAYCDASCSQRSERRTQECR